VFPRFSVDAWTDSDGEVQCAVTVRVDERMPPFTFLANAHDIDQHLVVLRERLHFAVEHAREPVAA